MLTSLNSFEEFFYDVSHFHIIFNVLYLMRETFKGSKLRHKRIHPRVLPTPTNLSSLRYITKSFWGIQRREENLENPCLSYNPMVEKHSNQTAECQSDKRLLEQKGPILTSLSQKGKHKSREERGMIQYHTAVQCHSWDQNSLPSIPILGLSTHHMKEQHSLPLGKEWGRYLRVIAWPHFTELYSDGVVKLRTL